EVDEVEDAARVVEFRGHVVNLPWKGRGGTVSKCLLLSTSLARIRLFDQNSQIFRAFGVIFQKSQAHIAVAACRLPRPFLPPSPLLPPSAHVPPRRPMGCGTCSPPLRLAPALRILR